MAGAGDRWTPQEMRRRFREAVRARGIEVRESPTAPPSIEDALDPARARARANDARLLALEAEGFVRTIPDGEPDADAPGPVGAHLSVVAVIAWLFSIDPIWQTLTPRHAAGIPAPQLLAVLAAYGVVWALLFWAWARWLPPAVRIFLRARLHEWKRWGAVAFLAVVAKIQLG